MSKRLVVVSNRLPVTFAKSHEGYSMKPSCGGLVTALDPVLRNVSGCWIGWTGTDHDARVLELLRTESSSAAYPLVPVFLTEVEKSCFYHGCSNEIIWPLFHDLQSRCNFDPTYWEVYREATEKFADAVEAHSRRDDLVWVHDYHLMLLGGALRDRGLTAKLAYFHHIPFPPPDIFEKLPWRRELLRGLLQYNLVGFQTPRDRRNFISCVRRYLRDVHVVSTKPGRFLVRAEGLCAIVGAFPISIDFAQFASESESAEVTTRANAIRDSLRKAQVVLGVDRLDYTKGIPERLNAIRHVLRTRPELRGRLTVVQIVVPSREDIDKYSELKISIERLVSEINGEFGTPEWIPVVYMHRCVARSELLSYYRAADVALVTPLKDGMNLVAKEFCASRTDQDGVLLLSEFAGVAEELGCGALLVNPYDTEGVAQALTRALALPQPERASRMRRMRDVLRSHDVHQWCAAFCSAFGQSATYSSQSLLLGARSLRSHAVA